MSNDHVTDRPSNARGRVARDWRAVEARDGRADGTFFFGVRSTSIYCRPSCPARRPLRANTLFFQTRQDAEREGYRPCRRCKPNEIPASALIVQRAAQAMENDLDEPVNVNTLARKLSVRTDALRRAFRQQTGLNPKELAAALRLKKFKRLLRE